MFLSGASEREMFYFWRFRKLRIFTFFITFLAIRPNYCYAETQKRLTTADSPNSTNTDGKISSVWIKNSIWSLDVSGSFPFSVLLRKDIFDGKNSNSVVEVSSFCWFCPWRAELCAEFFETCLKYKWYGTAVTEPTIGWFEPSCLPYFLQILSYTVTYSLSAKNSVHFERSQKFAKHELTLPRKVFVFQHERNKKYISEKTPKNCNFFDFPEKLWKDKT